METVKDWTLDGFTHCVTLKTTARPQGRTRTKQRYRWSRVCVKTEIWNYDEEARSFIKKYEAMDQQNLVNVNKMKALHDGSDTKWKSSWR